MKTAKIAVRMQDGTTRVYRVEDGNKIRVCARTGATL